MAIASSGTGTQAQSNWNISLTALNFGSVNVGSNSSQNITVTKLANAALTISSATSLVKDCSISDGAENIQRRLERNIWATIRADICRQHFGKHSASSNATGSPATIALEWMGVQRATRR